MTIEQPSFGQRVRELRRARGLSQGDLAGDGVSPSYVSLVESGRRVPSLKAARTIATRLGTTVEKLCEPGAGDSRRTHRLELVGQLVAARSSQLAGDWPAARRRLESVIEEAADSGLDEMGWEARWELAAVLERLDATDAREQTLRALADDPLTGAAPLLHVWVAAELSRLYRRQGDLGEAVRCAENAQAAANGLDADRPERGEAQVALLAAYVESGEWHRARDLADAVLEQTSRGADDQLRATALWAAAGVRHLDGHTETALKLLHQADDLLAPAVDMARRVRLTRARALLALEAGDDSAAALLEQARHAGALVPTPESASWLATLEVLADLRGADPSRALEHAAGIVPESPELPPLDRSRCAVMRARARRAAGREEEAEADFRTAAAGYETAGAYRLAMATWRELSDPGHPVGPDPHLVLMP
ncbi:helix-turn-helix domain-containing protein [Streptomyces sp. SBST2-5]|uniref:Helix-turn-helix domain-containing protein n=1 Tax=Streptomyces composti TaxID=2720025 RepID=A0ABX1AF66_9ACTN|nr:helix-turn-helix domain-containing protein [Streptomyces composti]NJP53835.1 helix-turn-helix domain-containing protein [Streptomyces composti]